MRVLLSPQARDDLAYWDRADAEMASQTRLLLAALALGKELPAPQVTKLKFGNISLVAIKTAHEHRLVVEPLGNDIVVHQCRFHY